MLRILFSLLCIKYFFSFYRSVGFEENIEYTKKGITSAMECADFAVHFHYMTKKIIFSLQVYFARSDGHKFNCNFASISCGFRQLKWILWLFHRSDLKKI